MKKMGLVIAFLLIICTLGVHPVAAQTNAYGYIPLLQEGYDTTLPRQIVSHQIYDLLVFDLLKAREQGQITGFEPDFYGGFVRVTLPHGASLRDSSALDIRSTLDEAVVRPYLA